MQEKELLSVKEAAKEVKVSEETIRRWIRSRKLHATVIGKSFYIDPWQLEMLIEGGQDLQSEDFDLLTAALGLSTAMKGALLFDQAFIKLEIQFHRIKEDNLNLQVGLLRQKKELEQQLAAMNEWSKHLRNNVQKKIEKLPDKPSLRTNNHYWQVPQKTLFVDIHFYFVAGGLIDLALKRLQKDINDDEINNIVNKYSKPLKELNDARNNLEHIDKEIDRASDLGNMSNGLYHFNGQNYDLHFENMLELRKELCDFLLIKAQKDLQSAR